MKPEIRSLLVTITSLISYHSGQLVIDWLREASVRKGLIGVREFTEITREFKRMSIDYHSMNMGDFAKLPCFH